MPFSFSVYTFLKIACSISTLSFSVIIAVFLKLLLMGPVLRSTACILVPSSSNLSVSVSPSMAYLLALYAPLPKSDMRPKTEECCMIFPCPCALITGMTCLVHSCRPKTLVSNCSLSIFVSMSSTAPACPKPALLNHTSIFPSFAKTVSMTDVICFGFLTSSCIAYSKPRDLSISTSFSSRAVG